MIKSGYMEGTTVKIDLRGSTGSSYISIDKNGPSFTNIRNSGLVPVLAKSTFDEFEKPAQNKLKKMGVIQPTDDTTGTTDFFDSDRITWGVSVPVSIISRDGAESLFTIWLEKNSHPSNGYSAWSLASSRGRVRYLPEGALSSMADLNQNALEFCLDIANIPFLPSSNDGDLKNSITIRPDSS
jgi:hypothetical protein